MFTHPGHYNGTLSCNLGEAEMSAVAAALSCQEQSVQNHPDFDNHERVVFWEDRKTNLKAVIAVHNTALGPALGGLRMWPYAGMDEALTDALRLARGMTYKSALANLPLGGGKAVIIGDPRSGKSRGLLLSMAEFINTLGGRYVSAEDSGTCVEDMKVMARRTPWVAGISDKATHGGDPSPSTAYGTYVGLKTAVKHRLGDSSLCGCKIAIQGVGNVGYHLAALLAEAGAELYVSDIQEHNANRTADAFGAKIVCPAEIHQLDVEVYSPCAMGGAINNRTISQFKAPVIAGAANNQLCNGSHGQQLHKRNILYAPDFAINAGGIIDIAYRQQNTCEAALTAHIDAIADTLDDIFQHSAADDTPPHQIANLLAEQRFLK